MNANHGTAQFECCEYFYISKFFRRITNYQLHALTPKGASHCAQYGHNKEYRRDLRSSILSAFSQWKKKESSNHTVQESTVRRPVVNIPAIYTITRTNSIQEAFEKSFIFIYMNMFSLIPVQKYVYMHACSRWVLL